MFSNPKPKVTFSRHPPLFALCISPLLSASPFSFSLLHLFSLIFLHAQLLDYNLLVVKLLLHASSAPKFEEVLVYLNLNALSAAPSSYSLSLISQICLLLFYTFYLCLSSLIFACSWPKCCGFVVLDNFSRFICWPRSTYAFV